MICFLTIMEFVSFKKSVVYPTPNQFVVKHPITPLREQSPIEFIIENNGHSFIDLRKTRLHIKCKLVKPNGDPVSATDKITLVNMPLQSLWRHVEVYFQNKLVSSSDNSYPYKAMLDVLCNYSEDCKESQLQPQLYYKDTCGYMDATDTAIGGNGGLTQRWNFTKDGKSVDMEGPLYCDILQQKHLFLNNIPIRIKLTPASNAFALMGEGRVVIDEALLWVCHVDLSPDIYTDIAKKLQKDTVKYSYVKSEFLCHSIHAGSTSLRLANLFQGRIPTQLVVVFVDTESFNGHHKKNPFNFQHKFLNYLDVSVNGRSLPRERPLQPDYIKQHYSDAFTLMFGSKWMKNDGNYISRDDFAKGYTIYILDLGADSVGNVNLEARFAIPLDKSTNMLIYASFPHVMEIDETRNVYL